MEFDLAVSADAPSDPDPASSPAADAAAPEEGTEEGAVEVTPRLRLGPGQAKDDDQLLREIVVLLFAASEPLTARRLVELLERPEPARVEEALERLRSQLEDDGSRSGLPLVLERIGGAWRLLTDPEMASVVGRLRAEPKPERISAAALETLAIIAYRQPVSKAEIEAIRGVQAGPVLRSLVDRGLARITGRADLPGQPLLYGTTKEFLEHFGLGSLKDLPRDGELNED
jgi:segregation and condensation protein B